MNELAGWICPRCGKVNAPWVPSCECVATLYPMVTEPSPTVTEPWPAVRTSDGQSPILIAEITC